MLSYAFRRRDQLRPDANKPFFCFGVKTHTFCCQSTSWPATNVTLTPKYSIMVVADMLAYLYQNDDWLLYIASAARIKTHHSLPIHVVSTNASDRFVVMDLSGSLILTFNIPMPSPSDNVMGAWSFM
jgi:hypothetical protein